MALAAPRHNSLSGMALGAASFALMTSVDTIFKLLVEHHPTHQIIFVNACFAFVPIFVWAHMTGGLTQLRTIRPVQHFARAAVSLMSAFAAVYAYSLLPLTDFYAIVFAGPLIVTAISALWLGESVSPTRWLAIFIGFAGILIVANPFGDITHSSGMNTDMALGRLAALVSIFCYAVSVVMIRRMRLSESSLTFTFYGYMTSFLVGGALLVLLGGAPLSGSDIASLAVSGTLAGISTICLITAYHRTPVSLVAPFQYTQIIWGAVAGYFIWAHMPEARLITGAAVVASCGLFVIYQEMHEKGGLLESTAGRILTIKE